MEVQYDLIDRSYRLKIERKIIWRFEFDTRWMIEMNGRIRTHRLLFIIILFNIMFKHGYLYYNCMYSKWNGTCTFVKCPSNILINNLL